MKNVYKFLKRLYYSIISSDNFVIVQIANPGAGNEWSIDVPDGEIWQVQSIRYAFTTSATVATRRSNIRALVGGVNIYQASNSVTQLLSLAYGYFFGSFANYNTQIGNAVYQSLNVNVFLEAGTTLTSQTDNIQVGDAYTNIFVSYRKYPV